jgi:hypothetical protein
VAATSRWYLYYQPFLIGKDSQLTELQSTIELCSTAKNDKQCFDRLEAAGRNPFEAYGLKWTDSGWDFLDNTKMVVAWESIAGRVGWALIPPAVVLALGSALVWAFRGFR